MIDTITRLNNISLKEKNREIRWAIIDDECDEVTAAGSNEAKTPPIIEEICGIGECVYIGFSATPQANLFSVHDNPMFPRDFCSLLRSPHFWNDGEEHPDDLLCYRVDSINKMYCGGWVFHKWCDAKGIENYFQIGATQYSGDDLDPHDVNLALAHYLVSGAARYIQGGRAEFRYEPVPLGTSFPKPHTMLINPSSATQGHLKSAKAVINSLRSAANKQLITEAQLKVDGVIEEEWNKAKVYIEQWILENSGLIVNAYENQNMSFDLVDRPSWDADCQGMTFPTLADIQSVMRDLIHHIKLKILNGKTNELLKFDETMNPDGTINQPDDIYTIAIGGNKLGRGITLDGLCTTLYLTNQTADDTTIQRQRWFGYRGSHIEYIRVFIPSYVWASSGPNHAPGLSEINSEDERLKEVIAVNENNQITPDIHHPAWSYISGSNISNKTGEPHSLGFAGRQICRWMTPSAHALGPDINTSNLNAVNRLYQQMIDKGMPASLWQHPIKQVEIEHRVILWNPLSMAKQVKAALQMAIISMLSRLQIFLILWIGTTTTLFMIDIRFFSIQIIYHGASLQTRFTNQGIQLAPSIQLRQSKQARILACGRLT